MPNASIFPQPVRIQCFALNITKLIWCQGENTWDDIFITGFNTSSRCGKTSEVIMSLHSTDCYVDLTFLYKDTESIDALVSRELMDLLFCILAPTIEKVATFFPDTHYHLCKISCWSLEYTRYCTCTVQISNWALGSRADICTVQYLLLR